MKKWIFRLLVLIAVVIGMALFGLKVLSGTSDTHKRGLEQAFSAIFKGEAKFGALNTFNLFPQFAMEIEKLEIGGVNNAGNVTADKFQIAFGSYDLIAKNRIIENFHLQNFNATETVFTPLALHFDDMGLYPSDKPDAGKISFKGTYGTQDLNGEFTIGMKAGVQPKYFFNEQNPFAMNIGAVQVSGIFRPYIAGGAKISDLKLFAQKKDGPLECAVMSGKQIDFSVFLNDVVTKVAQVKTPQDVTQLCGSIQ